MTEHHFEIFADYFQLYVEDEQVESPGDIWSPQAWEILLAVAPGVLGIGTVRNMEVPVTIQLADAPPSDPVPDIWDQVNECSLHVPSGSLVVRGSTDYRPDAARLTVTPGWYRARVYYGGLNTVDDSEMEGDDHYKITLWPAPEADRHVLKQRTV